MIALPMLDSHSSPVRVVALHALASVVAAADHPVRFFAGAAGVNCSR
jgi:hypothetical protein